MGNFIPGTKKEQQAMLQDIGFRDWEDLFRDIPEDTRFRGELDMPPGRSDLEVEREIRRMAGKNRIFPVMLRGAGAYDHYVPAAVDEVSSREEFLTAYTPYQAEISQGILQSIFEYQTMICELTGMDVSNASLYDGASAAAEACGMACDRKKKVLLLSETLDPGVVRVIRTYAAGRGQRIVMVPAVNGAADPAALEKLLGEEPETAGFLMQYPNYFGIVEDADKLAEITRRAGAKFLMHVNPLALGVLKTPGEIGADIVSGEGQPLGLGLAYGGPYLGILACRKKLMRSMVGRLVGETKDSRGDRGYVLTLQAREQHIRREKASSNVCSNQALCALKASVYLAAVGPAGLRQAAVLCSSKAHYLAERLAGAGLTPAYDRPFFHEFVTVSRDPATKNILHALADNGILGGFPLSDHKILWCATEKNTKEDMDRAAAIVAETLSGLSGSRAGAAPGETMKEAAKKTSDKAVKEAAKEMSDKAMKEAAEKIPGKEVQA
ncbi:aminomethyl-transferring glycine dehydrogenase subunit GcvPA [Eubacterium pyruvativorans]|uniref:aminomethyl-transferring glycine dehydrogenase subunit GcvPA n=2 Tax=Eubacterium pyruvativorans TaxID=155865 RepID=UPI0023F4240B|nr:aminomethyl-transferring glycine dehydrogenase subunit GcvPA [Eubacterium pyruvativorans]MDD7684234.1 aminomethyl-transferring glycine dehydrogenase subunit GcvPA [Eubacterium pyruvativorans]